VPVLRRDLAERKIDRACGDALRKTGAADIPGRPPPSRCSRLPEYGAAHIGPPAPFVSLKANNAAHGL
jgi:hypothetical protein